MAKPGHAIYTVTYTRDNASLVKIALESTLLSYGGGGSNAGGGRFRKSWTGSVSVDGTPVSITHTTERSPTGVEMGITTIMFPELYNTPSLRAALEGIGYGASVTYSSAARGGAQIRRSRRRRRQYRRSTHRRR
jgi:hypothetical protein